MLYLNGTNLESEGGEATSNLISLLSVDFPDSVNVVIYTGGTSAWQNDTISAEHNQIWHVEDGGNRAGRKHGHKKHRRKQHADGVY